MKILVTGANGFIGRNIKSILPQEAEVIGIGHSDNPLPMANYKKIDVLDATAVEELFREYRFDKVIHLAAVTFHDDIVKTHSHAHDSVCHNAPVPAFFKKSCGRLCVSKA